MVWDGVLICIAVITAIVIWLRWNYDHFKKRGIPYVEPTIIFGNVKDVVMRKTNMAVVADRLYKAFPNEPVVGFFSMRSPVLMIKDWELIKAVLITDFNSFRNNGMAINRDTDPILGRNPFFLKDEEWKDTRRVQTHNHTSSKLRTLYGYVDEVKDELITHLKNNIGKKFDAKDFSSRFTMDIVSSCVFGIKTHSFANEETELKKRSERIFDMSWRMLLWRLAPKVLNKLKIAIMQKTSQDYFYNLVKSIVEHRKSNNLSRADFIQNLINNKSENLSVIDMTAQTMTFFIDGYATSATEMSFMLYMLAIYPHIQERLRDEVKSENKLDFDTLHRLPYLDAVFNETLRMYPVGVTLMRECNQDTTITVNNKKYEFKNGDKLEIPVYAFHRDHKNFPDPLKFDPERFLNDPNNQPLLTFGAGPRACLGTRFAKTQIKAGVAAIVQNARIVPGTNDWSMPTVDNNKRALIAPDSEMSIKFESLM